MHSEDKAHHISSQFDLELEGIHDKVLAMGGLVQQQFKLAIEAFIDCEAANAENVIRQIPQIDDYEIAIQKECTEILAVRQPEAFDLRMLVVIIKTITELHRIGHVTGHIARRAIQCGNLEKKAYNNHEIKNMYRIAKDMLHQALESYAALKKDNIREITAHENRINREYISVFQELVARMMDDRQTVKHAMNVLFTVRDIDCIAENAVHICKNVFYLLEGENVEHLNAAEITSKLAKPAEP